MLHELLEEDIERVDGPSSWVSPLVVVPKADSDIRICIDMKRANQAIQRERHPIPTVEEMLYELNGSSIFRKLDLKSAFHQIMLAPESLYVTTFTTHCELFRYKRLFFGITSAPETCQERNIHYVCQQL